MSDNQYYYTCQFAEHNESKCFVICTEMKCKSKRIACIDCLQNQNHHLQHKGKNIQEFIIQVKHRMANLNKLDQMLTELKLKFDTFFQEQKEFIQKHLKEGNDYLTIDKLNKVEYIEEYFIYEQDDISPFVQQQLEKIGDKLVWMKECIEKVKNNKKNESTKEIHDLIKQVIKLVNEKNEKKDEYVYYYVIKLLDQGLKIDPTNCSLISLKCTCLQKIHKLDLAKKLNSYALQINQNDDAVLLFQTKVLMNEKKYDEILKDYEFNENSNKQLAFFKLQQLQQQNLQQTFKEFKYQCIELFGEQFNQDYQKHLDFYYKNQKSSNVQC